MQARVFCADGVSADGRAESSPAGRVMRTTNCLETGQSTAGPCRTVGHCSETSELCIAMSRRRVYPSRARGRAQQVGRSIQFNSIQSSHPSRRAPAIAMQRSHNYKAAELTSGGTHSMSSQQRRAHGSARPQLHFKPTHACTRLSCGSLSIRPELQSASVRPLEHEDVANAVL